MRTMRTAMVHKTRAGAYLPRLRGSTKPYEESSERTTTTEATVPQEEELVEEEEEENHHPEEYSRWFRWYLWVIAREVIPESAHKRKVRARARDLVVYLLFMTVAFVSAVSSQRYLNPFDASQGEQDFFFFAEGIKNQLTGNEIGAEYVPNTAKTFLDVATVEEYYQWMWSTLPNLFSESTFDGQSRAKCVERGQVCMQPGFTLGPVQIFGGVRIGQVRSKVRRSCAGDRRLTDPGVSEWVGLYYNATTTLPPEQQPRCFGDESGKFTYRDQVLHEHGTESKEDFGVFNLTGVPFTFDGVYTAPGRLGQTLRKSRRPKAERKKTASTYLSAGNYVYPAPGFSLIVDPRRATPEWNLKILHSLAESHYIDLQTRAVFVDLVFYNPMLKIFTKARCTLELTRSGGARPSYYADTVRLFFDLPSKDLTPGENVVWGLRFVALGSFYLYYGLQCAEEIRRVGFLKYVRDFLRAAQLANVIFFMTAWVLRLFVAFYVLPSKTDLDPYGFDYDPRFHTAARLIRHATCLEALNAFLNWFKLITYLSISPSFALLTKTLAKAIGPLISFCYVFVVVFYGFAQAHSMIFHDRLFEFRTLSASSFTLLRSLLGDFDFKALRDAEQFWGPVFFIVFVSLANFIILNTVIAIISDAYQEVDIEMKNAAASLHDRGLEPNAEARELMAEAKIVAADVLKGLLPKSLRTRLGSTAQLIAQTPSLARQSTQKHPGGFFSAVSGGAAAVSGNNPLRRHSSARVGVATDQDEAPPADKDHPGTADILSLNHDTDPDVQAKARAPSCISLASLTSVHTDHLDTTIEDDSSEGSTFSTPRQIHDFRHVASLPETASWSGAVRGKRKFSKAEAMANLNSSQQRMSFNSPAAHFERLALLTRKLEAADPSFFAKLSRATDQEVEAVAEIVANTFHTIREVSHRPATALHHNGLVNNTPASPINRPHTAVNPKRLSWRGSRGGDNASSTAQTVQRRSVASGRPVSRARTPPTNNTSNVSQGASAWLKPKHRESDPTPVAPNNGGGENKSGDNHGLSLRHHSSMPPS